MLFVPLKGVSAIDVEGQPFHDAEADEALFAALSDGLDGKVEVNEVDANVNDPAFAGGWPTSCTSSSRRREWTARRRSPRLRAQVAAGTPVIGAGAGTGISAKCAEAGGVDLIIIYNSGRYRMAGPRLARGHDALRRRQRDRHGHGARGAADRERHAGAGRASAAPTRSG